MIDFEKRAEDTVASLHIDIILAENDLERTKSNYVQWRKDGTRHPRNWSAARKVFDVAVIIFLEFYATLISTTGPSAAISASNQHGLGEMPSLIAFTLLYQIGQAIGGIIIPPFSESVGRKPHYLVSTIVFSLSCFLVGASPSIITIGLGRFISGLASAVPAVVIAGSIEDLFNRRSRVWVVFIWNSATTLALVLGPIYGSYIAEAFGWKWIYYSAANVSACSLLLLLCIRESRPNKLLRRKVRRIEKATNYNNLRIDNPDALPDFTTILSAMFRPLYLLVTEPIVIMVSIISAISWGLIYLFADSLPRVYSLFHITGAQASLPFLAIGAGIPLSILIRIWDMRIVRRRISQHRPVEPEDKMLGLSVAVPCLALGLWIFFWSIPPLITSLPCAVSMLGLVLVGFAVNELACTLSGYLADAYTVYASSAFASLSFLRALVSGLLPLAAEGMFTNMGANWAGTILASVATLFCVVPWVFRKYSKVLRERSKFARWSTEVHRKVAVNSVMYTPYTP